MKSKNEKKQKDLKENYQKIMKGFQKPESSPNQNSEWQKSGDFIVKFSLYQETPRSITSTDTSVTLGL